MAHTVLEVADLRKLLKGDQDNITQALSYLKQNKPPKELLTDLFMLYSFGFIYVSNDETIKKQIKLDAKEILLKIAPQGLKKILITGNTSRTLEHEKLIQYVYSFSPNDPFNPLLIALEAVKKGRMWGEEYIFQHGTSDMKKEVIRENLSTSDGKTYLSLTNRNLSLIPDEITHFDNDKIDFLDISGNKFESFPLAITQLSSLKELNFSSNPKVKELPDEIRNLQNLTFLGISYGGIAKLNKAIESLQKLEKLMFIRYEYKKPMFPEEILRIESLKQFCLGPCIIPKGTREELLKMKKLEKIMLHDMYGNKTEHIRPFENIP